MGVIIKESFNQTVLRIIISMIGAFALILIYPLDRELYGLYSYVLGTSALLMPLVVLGLGQAAMRFFPYVGKDGVSKRAFFLFITKIFLINSVVFLALFYLAKGLLVRFAANPSPEYEYYLWYIGLGTILFSVIEMLVKYLSNYKIVAVPVALQTLYKIGTPIAFALVYFGFLDKEIGVWIIFSVLIVSLIILIYMSLSKLNRVDAIDVEAKGFSNKDFFSYYIWAFASSAGSLIALKIDAYMVPALTNFEATGDYNMAVFMTTLITIPISAVISIAHPVISEAWKNNDLGQIKKIYIKGSENLLYVGVAMLLILFSLLDFLPMFFKHLASIWDLELIQNLSANWNELRYLKLLVMILGISKLFDMASGVNGVIIQHSVWYKYNTFFILLLVVMNVVLNIYFINWLFITGAAIATTISLVAFNILKTGLIYKKIHMHPFSWRMILFIITVIGVSANSFYLSNVFSSEWAFLSNIIISITFLLVWLYYLGFAEDTRTSLENIIRKRILKK